MSSILNTLGYTVRKYLNFATGVHIRTSDHEYGEPEAAVNLESVACLIEYEGCMSDTVYVEADSSIGIYRIGKKKDAAYSKTPLPSFIVLDAPGEYETKGHVKQLSYHYGTISDKICEACVCMLAC